MSDYISREALIGKVEKHYCAPCKGQGGDLDGDWCRSCVINSVLEKVRGIPAADVAAVCSFGVQCIFGEGCSYENGAVKNGRYVAVDRIGSENRKAYFYIDENGNMFVRAGCWFSDMEAFKERVKKVHAGTIHEKTYLAACDLAELMLKGE